jgi:hypothetical protein
MTAPTAYHQIGKFVVCFQHADAAINEILILLANADDEAVRILVNELEYSQRLKTADVMLARFVDLQLEPDLSAKADFHKLMGELGRLGERRNELVHSKYTQWFNVEGALGLIRQNSKLRASKGIRVEDEEELLPEAFNADFEHLDSALQGLEAFRLKVINWLYPDVQA